MDRLQSHIEGFDEVLGGGIPRGSLVLVCGTPGTMKTSLTFSLLYNNVKHNGSKALYISLEEGHEEIGSPVKPVAPHVKAQLVIARAVVSGRAVLRAVRRRAIRPVHDDRPTFLIA